MLQAFAAHFVAQRQQEVVVIVVMRAVELVHLLHQREMRLQLLGLDLQVLGVVGNDVQMHGRGGARVEIDALEIFAGIHRRIDQIVVIDRLEMQRVAILRCHVERGAGLPAGRQFQARLGVDLAGKIAGRIQRVGTPLHVEHFRRHHHAAFARALRRQILEADVDAAHALRYIDMKRVDVVLIARPGQHLAVRLHHQPGNLVDRTRRRVVARNPLRIQQGQRTGGDRDGFMHAEDAVRDVGGIDVDFQRAGRIRYVLRRRYRRRVRHIGKHAKGGQPEGGGGKGGSKAGDFQYVLRGRDETTFR
jgi:hypothetical protein